MNKIEVLVVDGDAIVRFGLAELLRQYPGYHVQAAVSTGEAAVRVASEAPLDLVVLDFNLADSPGLSLIGLLARRCPNAPILVLSSGDELYYGPRVLEAGAAGFVPKTAEPETFLAAVRQVLSGRRYVSDRLRSRLDRPEVGAHTRLTGRELEVLSLLGLGLTSHQIAARLHRSVKTVEAHRYNIKRKLGCHTANELLRYAVRFVEEEVALAG